MTYFGLTEPVQTVSTLCRHTYADPRKTAVVLGTGQGGTSLVAAVVDALGLPLSDSCGVLGNFESASRPSVFDDETTWFDKVRDISSRRDAWGFKDPNIFRFPVAKVHASLVNPYYLAVTRDLIAIAQRRRQGVDEAVLAPDVLRAAERMQREMWDWIFQLPPAPLLGISYQRALARPQEFVDGVIAFLAVQPTPQQRQQALERVSPSGGYWLPGAGEDEWKKYVQAGRP